LSENANNNSSEVLPEFEARRSTLKKMLVGGALLGSAAIFGVAPLSSVYRSVVSSSSAFRQTALATEAPASISYPLPRSPAPASSIYTVSDHGQYGETISSLAGLLARTQPRIFLTGDDSATRIQSAIQNYYGTKFSSSKAETLCQMFAQDVASSSGSIKLVVYDGAQGGLDNGSDPYFPLELNIARTLAGVSGSLLVSSGDLSSVQSWFNGTSIQYDIRKGKGTNNWTSKLAGYQWLWNQVSSKVNKKVVMILPTGRIAQTDYIVQNSIYSFEFGTKATLAQDEKNFAATVLKSYPEGSAVLGFTGLGSEVPFVTAMSGGTGASKSSLSGSSPSFAGGLFYSPSDQCDDFSITAGYPVPSGVTVKSAPSTPNYVKGHKYVLFVVSQGGALGWDYGSIPDYMTSAQSAGLPLGVQLSNVLQWMNPPLFRWFVDNQASTTAFIAGPSGAGYNHTQELPNQSQYFAACAALGSNIGMKDWFGIFAENPFQSSVAGAYISGIKSNVPNMRSLFLWESAGEAAVVYSGVPVIAPSQNIQAINNSSMSSSQIASIIKQSASSSDFVYLVLNTSWPSATTLKSAVSACGSNYTAVRSDQFANLVRQSLGLSVIN
jgi:GxGYxYP putative glycoside hydrolase C-terminal domain/GxGYxY sequence motif in domain of unknown function N-terminal